MIVDKVQEVVKNKWVKNYVNDYSYLTVEDLEKLLKNLLDDNKKPKNFSDSFYYLYRTLFGYESAVTDLEVAKQEVQNFLNGISSPISLTKIVDRQSEINRNQVMHDFQVIRYDNVTYNATSAKELFREEKQKEFDNNANHSFYFTANDSFVKGKINDTQAQFLSYYYKNNFPVYSNQIYIPFENSDKEDSKFGKLEIEKEGNIQKFVEDNFKIDSLKKIMKVLSMLVDDSNHSKNSFYNILEDVFQVKLYQSDSSGEKGNGSVGLTTLNDGKSLLFKYHLYNFVNLLQNDDNSEDG